MKVNLRNLEGAGGKLPVEMTMSKYLTCALCSAQIQSLS